MNSCRIHSHGAQKQKWKNQTDTKEWQKIHTQATLHGLNVEQFYVDMPFGNCEPNYVLPLEPTLLLAHTFILWQKL